MAYLSFPSLDALCLVLHSQALPATVQVTACKACQSQSGEWFVEPSQTLARENVQSVAQFGVKLIRDLPAKVELTPWMSASCWQQLVPLRQSASDAESVQSKTVMFRIDTTDRFTSLASEIIRLGNDRISFRRVQYSASPSDAFTLLRVIDPPYYTLVDVLDRSVRGEPGASVVGYREQSPRVWVQLGYEHPLATSIDPPAGHFLLVDPPHEFRFVQEAPFQDIYQAMELRLPQPLQAWQPQEATTRLRVPLTLTAAQSNNAADLWVVRQNAMEQLEQLVTRSDDQLLERLAFAVIHTDTEPTVVLRVRPGRTAPPILVLDALACCTYLRLPNLFVPIGMRLQPPLRRDAIAQLLASDNRMITWLETIEPRDTARRSWPFRAQSIADAAFRPLGDWVEYVLEHHATELETWTASHRFDFEAFICKEDLPETRKPSPGTERSTVPKPPAAVQPSKKARPEQTEESVAEYTVPPAPPTEQPHRVSTNEFIEQLKQAEAAFLASSATLDAPERAASWQRLGWLNSQLKHQLDATICWSNLLWYEGHMNAELSHQWLQAELRSAGLNRIDIRTIRQIVTGRDNRGKDASLVAAYVARAVTNEQGRGDLRAISAQLTRFFEANERYLPVRLVWLTAWAMHRLVGGDTLGLARVRDRLLDRLYELGLMSEFDIVSFLRGSGQSHSVHNRLLRDRWQDLCSTIQRWLNAPILDTNQTPVYVKFIFAYCLVRIGEVISGREMLHTATESLKSKEMIHLWMGLAFNHRIEQAAQGGNNREPLPKDLVRQLEVMDRLDRYKIDRMRQHSRVLEPHDRIDPYRRWHRRYTDELFQTLAELKDLLDLKKVEARLRSLMSEHPNGPRGLRVLASALEYAPRLGDQFATALLDRVGPLLASCEDVIEKSLLLQRALYVAAHFGHTKRVNSLVVALREELPAIVDNYLQLDSQYNPVDKERIETVETLLQHSFRGLRKLGMHDELSTLYNRVAELVELHDVQARQTYLERLKGNDASLSRRLSLLLCVASGYYFFGNHEEADKTVDKVRRVLLGGSLSPVEQRRLANAYVVCVALGKPEAALNRIFELFQRDRDGQRLLPKIEDTMTTSSHFSVSELELIETSLLALLSDESSWDPQAQLWLDQDEFAIRKKIHADMRHAMGSIDL